MKKLLLIILGIYVVGCSQLINKPIGQEFYINKNAVIKQDIIVKRGKK